jgi:hypothetical protein
VGTAGPLGAGAVAVGAADELAVGDAAADVVIDGVATGVVGADRGGAAVMAGDMLDVGGTGRAGDLAGPAPACPETACPETACLGGEPGEWCTEAARATPPAADAASRPTTIETIVSGRASRR